MTGWRVAQRRWPTLESLVADVRYAARGLLANRAFTVVAVAVLTLGIGANTAIFSVIDAVMLRPLPIRAPRELVQVVKYDGATPAGENFSYPQVTAFASHDALFPSLFGVGASTVVVRKSGRMVRARAAWVTGSYYDTLGVPAIAGRVLTRADDQPKVPAVAVITESYWDRTFARDVAAIGATIEIENVPVVIVGVTPGEFRGVDVAEIADVTLPINARRQVGPRGAGMLAPGTTWLRVFGRLHPNASPAGAGERLTLVWKSLASVGTGPQAIVSPRQSRIRLAVADGSTGTTPLREQFRQPLFVVMTIVGLILLIACANVANLLLARGSARQREMAVRTALGATRGRIVRQLLVESVLLAFAGAAGGIVVATWAGRALVSLLAAGFTEPLLLEVEPNSSVLLFTLLTAVVTAVVFGVVPAFRVSRSQPPGALVNVGTSRVTRSSLRVATGLVVAQTALALILLIAAGLFARSLSNLRAIDAGFSAEGVLLVRLDGTRESTSDLTAFYERLRTAAERIRGVRAASFSVIAPPSGGGGISLSATVDGQPAASDGLHVNSVSPRYFEAMATPVVEGREFSVHDTAAAARVVIINQAFASRYLPAASALGHRIGLPAPVGAGDMSIVGVVKDAVYESARAGAPPTIYVPFAQTNPAAVGAVTFEVAADLRLHGVAESVGAEFQRHVSQSPVDVRTLAAQVERTLIRERLVATLAASFGGLGLTLTAVGLYGLLAYLVVVRRKEIGIQLALGATPRRTQWTVMRRAFLMLGTGAVLGVPMAWAGVRFISGLLFGVEPVDLANVAAAALTLTAAGALAAFVPARRASRVDAVLALRED